MINENYKVDDKIWMIDDPRVDKLYNGEIDINEFVKSFKSNDPFYITNSGGKIYINIFDEQQINKSNDMVKRSTIFKFIQIKASKLYEHRDTLRKYYPSMNETIDQVEREVSLSKCTGCALNSRSTPLLHKLLEISQIKPFNIEPLKPFLSDNELASISKYNEMDISEHYNNLLKKQLPIRDNPRSEKMALKNIPINLPSISQIKNMTNPTFQPTIINLPNSQTMVDRGPFIDIPFKRHTSKKAVIKHLSAALAIIPEISMGHNESQYLISKNLEVAWSHSEKGSKSEQSIYYSLEAFAEYKKEIDSLKLSLTNQYLIDALMESSGTSKTPLSVFKIIGHMVQAEEEVWEINPDIASKIKEERNKLLNDYNYKPNLKSLINLTIAIS